jgi:GTP cyclohydrolase I
MTPLPDVQCTEPKILRPINQVGVENVEVPFKLELRAGGFIELVAKVSMRTSLDEDLKGISMSRFLRTLKKYLHKPLKRVLIKEILRDFKKKVGGNSSFIKFNFKLPIERKSPISEYTFPIYYDCRFEGQLIESDDFVETGVIASVEKFRFFQGMKIQYASYCPCSAELCNHLGEKGTCGFPHNQRSFAEILIESYDDELALIAGYDEVPYIWLEDIIEAVEMQLKTLPYPIIKRVDEQEIARIAAENPMFVEDAIRSISAILDSFPIKDWIVKCVHEESIHTSEAIAVNWAGIPGGFDGTRFI